MVKSDNLIVIAACAGTGVVFILLIVLVTLCKKYHICCFKRRRRRAEKPNVTDGLVPPIFYTDGMKDPLMQEDLSERVLKKVPPTK